MPLGLGLELGLGFGVWSLGLWVELALALGLATFSCALHFVREHTIGYVCERDRESE
jgi:hypothetical protein